MNNRERREKGYSIIPSLFLALMMIATGGLMTNIRLFGIEYGDSMFFVEDNWFGLIGRIVLIFGGLAILYTTYKKKGNYFAVGVYALTLGLSRIIRSMPGLTAQSDITFYASLVFTVIGGNLAWGGYNHITVKTRNPGNMKYTSMFLLVFICLILGFSAYMEYDVIATFLEDITLMGYLPLYLGLLIVLYSRELTENAPFARIVRTLRNISSSLYVGNTIRVTEKDAEIIQEGFSSAKTWRLIYVGNMAIRENTVEFHTNGVQKDVILEKWPGSDELYITIINDREDSLITGHRIQAVGYDISGDIMTLYDSEGACTIIRIGGTEP